MGYSSRQHIDKQWANLEGDGCPCLFLLYWSDIVCTYILNVAENVQGGEIIYKK
jgi:hypothetical protein